jgi:hypothetical protein
VTRQRKRSRTDQPVRGRGDFEALPVRSRDARTRAFDALARMRSSGLSLTAAAAKAGTTPATVRRYVGPVLSRQGRHIVASRADRLYRRMSVLTPDGRRDIDIRGSRAASRVAAHWAALDHYLTTGDDKPLRKFAGVRVGGVALAAKPSQVEKHWTRGELDIDDIYPDR